MPLSLPFAFFLFPFCFHFGTDTGIGARGAGECANFYGSINEVSAYKVALKPAQVQSICKAGRAGKRPTPWPPAGKGA